MTLGLDDLEVDSDLMQSVVDVERSTAVGRDNSGARILAWVKVYTALPCGIDLRNAGNQEAFDEEVQELSGTVYFTRQADGTLPTLTNHDRLVFGVWPGTTTARHLMVQENLDELERGVILVAPVKARRPG